MSNSEPPEIVLTRADGLVLFDAAVERDDFERADIFAELLLRVNDREEEDA